MADRDVALGEAGHRHRRRLTGLNALSGDPRHLLEQELRLERCHRGGAAPERDGRHRHDVERLGRRLSHGVSHGGGQGPELAGEPGVGGQARPDGARDRHGATEALRGCPQAPRPLLPGNSKLVFRDLSSVRVRRRVREAPFARQPLKVSVGLACVTSLLVATACGGSDASGGGDGAVSSGIVRNPPPVVDIDPVPDAAAGGRPMRLRADQDGLLLVFFGYTFCPDVCPTTMADLRTALGALDASQARRVKVAMITVDPGRDSGEALLRYVRAFVPNGHAVSISDAELLHRVASRFGAGYEVSTGADGEIEVVHTAFLYAVDDQGRLVLQWPFRTPPDAIRRDLDALLDSMSGER